MNQINQYIFHLFLDFHCSSVFPSCPPPISFLSNTHSLLWTECVLPQIQILSVMVLRGEAFGR